MNYINNWLYPLDGTLFAGDTSLPVPTAALARLGLEGGVQYTLTLSDSTGSAHEIISVTGEAGGGYSVTRGREGTADREWPAGSRIYCSITAGQLAALAGTAADSGWQPVAALNDYQYPPQARRINGVVYLRGFSWLGEAALGTEIAQLPEGWRPAEMLQLYLITSSRTRRLFIDPAGVMSVNHEAGNTGGDYVPFDGIAFPAD